MTEETNNKKTTTKRAPKTSRIPVDYDPTPEYGVPPKGYTRPESRSWVPRDLVQPMPIDHPLLTDDPSQMASSQRKHRFLATKAVSIKGEWWVKDRATGSWRVCKKAEAKACLIQDWGGSRTDFHICDESLDKFFTHSAFLVMDQTICVPGAGDFLQFRGRRCLNVGAAPSMAYPEETSLGEPFELLLRLIDQNLLDQGTREFDDILDDYLGEETTLGRWFTHWLASLYQRPGRHLPTTVWLIGSQQGIGKGEFTKVMSRLLGEGNASQVNLGEFRNDWNDFIEGKQLLVADEVNLSSKREFYDLIKRYIGNDTISLRRRNVGQFEVPNISNWIFTTNASRPITIEQDDRRNTFIATTERREHRALAAAFYRLSESEKREAVEGLASVLAEVEIDDAFIGTAYWTPLKAQLCDLSRKPLATWLTLDESARFWPVGSFVSKESLFEEYKEWTHRENTFAGLRSRTAFEEQVAELQKKGVISQQGRKRLSDGSRPNGFVRLDPETQAEPWSFEDVDGAPVSRRSKGMQNLHVGQRLRERAARGT